MQLRLNGRYALAINQTTSRENWQQMGSEKHLLQENRQEEEPGANAGRFGRERNYLE
jgi:hypothetical protein